MGSHAGDEPLVLFGRVAAEAFGSDTKYAMRCARLGFQCPELLGTGRLELPIQGEPADWLRAVRSGEVGFDEWWERIIALDAQLESLADDESFRPEPDRARIDSWCIDAHQRVWADGVDRPVQP